MLELRKLQNTTDYNQQRHEVEDPPPSIQINLTQKRECSATVQKLPTPSQFTKTSTRIMFRVLITHHQDIYYVT